MLYPKNEINLSETICILNRIINDLIKDLVTSKGNTIKLLKEINKKNQQIRTLRRLLRGK